MLVLDDLKLIHTRDSKDALGVAQKQWEQYKYDYHFSWSPKNEITKIFFSGMGGSGLAAKVYKSWPGVKLPFEIIQDYSLPKYFDSKTLIVVSSYSGNTEETISVMQQLLDSNLAEDKRPMIVTMASGGKLKEISEQNSLPFILLPSGYQPRMTIGFQLRALCEILDSSNLTQGTVLALDQSADWLREKLEAWAPTVPTKDNHAKKIAQDIVGKSVVIYASNQFAPLAYKWKIDINENAKTVAWCGQYPEFNHNEFLGWTHQPIEKPYAVIDLRSNLDHPQTQKRFELSDRLLSGKRPSPEIIKLEGDDLLHQIIWSIGLGDFVSLYLAILSNIDPTPVDLSEKFKLMLQ